MKKLWIPIFCLAILTGCSKNSLNVDSKQNKPQQIITVDPTLPKPSNVRTISGHSQIGFEWLLMDNPRITAISIYKSDANGSFSKIGTIEDRFATHFVSVGLDQDTTYYYRFSTNAGPNVESDLGAPVAAKTLPVIEPVSFIAPVDNLPKRAKIVWAPHLNNAVIGYQIQKTDATGRDWAVVATVGPRLMAEYIDTNVQSGQIYTYRIIAKTFEGQLGLPSKSVQVRPKNLPLAIVDINATKTLPKKIVVQWKGPKQSFAEYQLYKTSTPEGVFEPVIRTKETIYHDNIGEDGAIRYYKVSVIDKDGLESSAQQVATGMTRPVPPAPMFSQATVQENKVQLAWNKPDTKQSLKYKVTKRWGSIAKPKEFIFEDIQGTFFSDTDVEQGEKYTYFVQSVDKEGLVSSPSDSVELAIPKLAQ